MGSAISEHVVRVAALEALSRAGIPHGSRLAAQLQAEAKMSDVAGSCFVNTVGGLSLDDRIVELRRETRYSSDLPDVPHVQATDETSIRANFDAIASGKIKVVK